MEDIMATQPDPNTLDITHEVEDRITINIGDPEDPERCNLLRSSDLGAIESQRLNFIMRKYRELSERIGEVPDIPDDIMDDPDVDLPDLPTYDENDLRKIEELLIEFVRTISPIDPPRHIRKWFVPMTDEALQTLSIQELIMLVDFFIDRTGLAIGKVTNQFTTAATRLRQTGVLSSRNSKRITKGRTR